MRILSDSEQEINGLIQDKLKKMSYPDWIYPYFQTIATHPDILGYLDEALRQTTESRMNKHGVKHGLKVAWNALQLFELIDKGLVSSDYLKGPRALPDKPGLLFTILIASYIHDIGRFFVRGISHEEHIGMALEIIQDQATHPGRRILRPEDRTGLDIGIVRDRIKEMCLCHDKKEEPSDKAEIALIKLADCLDCDENRAYEIRKFEYGERMKEVFFEDKFPEKYFGTRGVKSVDLHFNEREGKMEITFAIYDYAASIPINTVLNVLKGCKGSRGSANQLPDKIRLIVKEIGRKEDKHTYTLYPRELVETPGARLLGDFYKFDIYDMDGSTRITDIFAIKNERDVGGIRSHPIGLGGWQKISGKDPQLSIKMYNLKAKEELETVYKGSTDGGITHVWSILFKPKLLIDDKPIGIKGVYHWPRFFKVEYDEIAHIAKVPTNNYRFTILFPKEIKTGEIEAYFEIADSPSPEGIVTRGKLSAQYNESESRTQLNYVFKPIKVGYIYKIKWKRRS